LESVLGEHASVRNRAAEEKRLASHHPNPGDRSTQPVELPPAYAYLAQLSHPNLVSVTRDPQGDFEYYIRQARQARQAQNHTVAMIFYEKAWELVPPAQRQKALRRSSNPKHSSEVSPATQLPARL
jgi:hypothetical protein